MLNLIQSARSNTEWVEIINIGVNILIGSDPTLIREAAYRAIYEEDEGKQLRKSHLNPEITIIYEEFLKKPLGEKSHHLLHTEYAQKVLVR